MYAERRSKHCARAVSRRQWRSRPFARRIMSGSGSVRKSLPGTLAAPRRSSNQHREANKVLRLSLSPSRARDIKAERAATGFLDLKTACQLARFN